MNLNKKQKIKITEKYAPTTRQSDEEADIFYEIVDKGINKGKINLTILIGDFNAQLDIRTDINGECVGCFRKGSRNVQGERLVLEFANYKKLKVTNTYFKKDHKGGYGEAQTM